MPHLLTEPYRARCHRSSNSQAQALNQLLKANFCYDWRDRTLLGSISDPRKLEREYRWSWHEPSAHAQTQVWQCLRWDQAAAKLMKERNPRLVGLTPQEALQALKVELKEYHKGADPFNCKICKHENIQDWFLAVQKDETIHGKAETPPVVSPPA
ncbi:hypothetical protein EDB19DRAFT_1941288 [Suillus lakei]|nr:hypothetical protein EDB19DRAFT_1941288 [Suillus lakei]